MTNRLMVILMMCTVVFVTIINALTIMFVIQLIDKSENDSLKIRILSDIRDDINSERERLSQIDDDNLRQSLEDWTDINSRIDRLENPPTPQPPPKVEEPKKKGFLFFKRKD